jgi:hypothetical protein
MPAVAVTPAGVRDGEPAALIGLCSARGPSVLAYCRHVAGDAEAAAAAADAFARFRAAVVATDDLADLNPEALLISATRSAAADHVGSDAPDDCAEVPSLLAARADKTASSADLERLERHLDGCWACRAPVARFKAAERAYRDPPDPTLDPEIAAQIFVALATAAPARGAEPPAPAPAPSKNGGARRAPAAGVLPVIGGDDDDATTEYQTLDALGSKPPRGRFATRAPIGPRPRTATTTAAARPPLLEPGASVRPSLRLPVVLPIGLVLLALLVALFVSGVFGGSDPASSPSVPSPTTIPSDTPPADVVAVPGAKEASARAVEIAKARDRERERAKREPAAAPKRKAAAGTPATPPPPPPPPAAVTPPPAAATSPPAAPAKKPAPKANANTGGTEGGGSNKAKGGNGATGSEQIPPAQDSKNVPDLAPPPEPATSP